jgi:hypothetical protein
MHQNIELPGSIAQDDQLRRHPLRDHTPQQRPFGGDSSLDTTEGTTMSNPFCP